MDVSVIGAGYLGATYAACLASLGHHVVGIDTDGAKVAALNHGRVPFHEPGLPQLVGEGLANGRLRFSTDYRDLAQPQLHLLCVGTPQQQTGFGADLGRIDAAVERAAPIVAPGSLLVGKSTVPVGTAARIQKKLRRLRPEHGVRVAWNPEFLREGHGVHDALQPDRLVFGTTNAADVELLGELYAPLIAAGTPVIATDLATAELAKVSANVMLAARISLVNLLAEVCEAARADIAALTDILALDERLGSQYLEAGLGYGGGCLPKDCRAFIARASELGVVQPTRLLQMVDQVNQRQRQRAIQRTRTLVGGAVAGKRIAVLGAAFKPGSDDIRDSPALAVATGLYADGATIQIYDPRANLHVRREHPYFDVAADAHQACRGADAVLVLTDWPEFQCLDPVMLASEVAHRRVLDARRTLPAHNWRQAGWQVVSWGVGQPCGS